MHINTRPQFDSDIIIVGSGPAGASAATHLARAGLKVILIDRQSFPRDKICGDLVSPLSLRELKKLGITALPQYKETNKIHRAAIFINGKEQINTTLPSVEGLPPYGRVISRIKLDHWIFNAARAAGAHILENHKVTSFDNKEWGIKLTAEGPAGIRTLYTKLLIGADGSHSIIARLLRGGYSAIKDKRIFAIRAYFEGVKGPLDKADLYLSKDSFPGYCWLFPAGNNMANVGIGMMFNTIPHAKFPLRKILFKLIKQDAGLNHRLSAAKTVGNIVGWPIPTYNPKLPIVNNRVMLIGDAAGLINPLSGEGIQFALLSGKWASQAALTCFSKDDFSEKALSPYSDRVANELRCDNAFSDLLCNITRNRKVSSVTFRFLGVISERAKVDSDYAHVVGCICAGLIPAKKTLSPKMFGKTIYQLTVSMWLLITNSIFEKPKSFIDAGRKTIRIIIGIINGLIRNPIFHFRRTVELLNCIIKLCYEIYIDFIKSVKKKFSSCSLFPLKTRQP